MQEKNLNTNKLSEENLILNENLDEYRHFLLAFSKICASMSSILDIDKLIAFFVGGLADIFKVNRVSFMILDAAKRELFLKASEGLKISTSEVRLKVGEAFGGWVAKNGDPLLVKDVEREYPELSRNRISRYLTKSFLILPVKIREDIVGILSLTDKKDQGIFSDEDLRLLTLMVHTLTLHMENITLLEKTNSLLKIDPLTELSNHRNFQEQLSEEINRAERYHRSISLIMLDIDNFSDYNRDYGYPAGDSALKQIAKIIKENMRRIDFAGRFGPEEFAVILPETRLKEAISVAERIKEKIAHSIFTQDRTSSLEMSRITVSMGVVQHRLGLSGEELIRQLTSALEKAKQKGKNCVCAYR